MEELDRKMLLTGVIKIYEATGSANFEGNERKYLEFCHTIKDKNGYTLGPGQPLSKETAGKIFMAVNSRYDYQFGNLIIPRNILHYSNSPMNFHILWYRKPEFKTITFRQSSMDGVYPVPGLLFGMKNESVFVFAYKGKIPGPNTKLYLPPFPNISVNEKNGISICWGNMKPNIKAGTLYEMVQSVEDSFWKSKFTDEGGINSMMKLQDIYKKIKNSKKEFPLDTLVPVKNYRDSTVIQLIQNL